MVIFPDVFSAWINGREKAITANWQDLANFNQVQQGQMANFQTLATMDPNINMVWDKASQENDNAQNSWLQTQVNQAITPGLVADATNQGRAMMNNGDVWQQRVDLNKSNMARQIRENDLAANNPNGLPSAPATNNLLAGALGTAAQFRGAVGSPSATEQAGSVAVSGTPQVASTSIQQFMQTNPTAYNSFISGLNSGTDFTEMDVTDMGSGRSSIRKDPDGSYYFTQWDSSGTPYETMLTGIPEWLALGQQNNWW